MTGSLLDFKSLKRGFARVKNSFVTKIFLNNEYRYSVLPRIWLKILFKEERFLSVEISSGLQLFLGMEE